MKDLNIKFNANIVDGSFTTVSDRNAIKQSVSNLLKTNMGERPYKSDIGSGLLAILSEPMSVINSSIIVKQIKKMLSIYEPRIEVLDITSKLNPELQSYQLTLTYNIANNAEIITQDLMLSTTN